MAEVARVSTPLTENEIADALIEGHRTVFGKDPNSLRLGCAQCHIDLENAHGKAVWDNNFGNITGGDEFYSLTTDEQVKPGEWKKMTLHYRAFHSPAAGAAAYWKLLSTKYAGVLDFWDVGDIKNGTYELKKDGFFSANVGPYAESMVEMFEAWKKKHGITVDDDPYANLE